MAEKISTLVIKVDLDCHLCYKKIRKTLCKLQDRENIRTISYDEKNNIVTVSGPFDPKKLTKKLYCKACKVIKDIQIVEPKEKEKEKEKEKPAEKPKEAKSEPAKEKEKPKESKPAEQAKPAKEKEKEKPKEVKPAEPAKPAKEKEKEKPKASAEPPKEKKEKPKVTFEPAKPVQEHPVGIVTQMPGPACPQSWAVGPVCQCGPWYEAHYGGSRCCACGRAYGWVSEGPPCDSYRTCHFFSDEDPASTCNVM